MNWCNPNFWIVKKKILLFIRYTVPNLWNTEFHLPLRIYLYQTSRLVKFRLIFYQEHVFHKVELNHSGELRLQTPFSMSPQYNLGRTAVLAWFVLQIQAVNNHCGAHGGGDPLEKVLKNQHDWHPLSTCTSSWHLRRRCYWGVRLRRWSRSSYGVLRNSGISFVTRRLIRSICSACFLRVVPQN